MSANRKMRDVDLNPCMEESDASAKCLDVNLYQKDMCTSYFIRYKQCRKFWHSVMIKRRGDGVKPAMPTAEERKQILESLGRVPY
ncbi:coiled-coil-helix-coiled-coil-helix domain-containing protein 7 [Pseudophryne corroboree]|uniref:coiled-coil-helix-coiled-coil-helix domain-containing protein 7 n=1 Tax=Pseudophryne corroboree TaxID=495146 RepID=UPI003082181E